jgi:hypothetical protein
MTIRGFLMTSMMSLVLGGCSVSFMGTPNSSAPGNNYGYGYAGKPISSVDYGQADDLGKPLHHGSAPSANKPDSQPTAQPSAPQRDEPVQPPRRTKPAPHRTKPTQPGDTRPDPTDAPTRPGSTDKPPTRRPVDPGSVDKQPTRRPVDPGSVDKSPTRRPVDPPSTKPDAPQRKAHLVPQVPHVRPKPAATPKQRDGVAKLEHRVVLHRAPTR